jgi:hypothetical protein
VEAIAQGKKNSHIKAKSLTAADVTKWLAKAEKGKKSKKNITALADYGRNGKNWEYTLLKKDGCSLPE